MVEHEPFKLVVAGSSPARLTILDPAFSEAGFFLWGGTLDLPAGALAAGAFGIVEIRFRAVVDHPFAGAAAFLAFPGTEGPEHEGGDGDHGQAKYGVGVHGTSSSKPVAGSGSRRAVDPRSSTRTTSSTCQVFTPVRMQPVTVFSPRPQARWTWRMGAP